jgi:glycosyltransferase involved in cell wall biosynthesis
LPPLVSIIIPHFNRPQLLAEALASVRASTEQRFEIIVVDDGSSAADWEAVQALADERTRIFRRSDGIKGPSRCRNLGLFEAKGDRVVFLDSDDMMASWCLEQRLMESEKAPDADFWVFPVMLFRDMPGDLDLLWNSMADGRDDVGRFVRSDPPWHTSSPLWKVSSLRKLGGFNEAVFYGDDADLHLRALLSGLKARQFPETMPDLFVRRSGAPRITNSLTSALIESRRIRLREGMRFLKTVVAGTPYRPVWEGQYIVEAEFLLFNHTPAKRPIQQVLENWQCDCRPSRMRRTIVNGYFSVALACRQHAYLILRIARRIVMKVLPSCYFPNGGQYHRARAEADVLSAIRSRLVESGRRAAAHS